jgi:hypothetical protein
MNNEPVAWIDPRELDMAVSTSVTKNKQFDTDIPLYTHPANIIAEILEKNKPEIEKANAYIKSLEDEIKVLKAKTLTDEEIWVLWELFDPSQDAWVSEEQVIGFAKAMFKKAQEK